MGKPTSYTTLDAIFVRLYRMGFTDLSEKDVVENCGDALEQIGCVNQYEEAVCFAEVKNFRVAIPNGCKYIVQIAHNHCHNENPDFAVVPSVALNDRMYDFHGDPFSWPPVNLGTLIEEAQSKTALSNINPSEGVILGCDGLPIQLNELAYYRPYFDLQWEYSPFINSRLYQVCFRPVRLSNHSFFHTLCCKEHNQGLYQSSDSEYTVYTDKTLRFSFERGQVAISYTRPVLDKESGWPMLPEDISFINALVYYNVWKITEADFYKQRQGSQTVMDKAESNWIWYCGQASNKLMMLQTVDEYQNFLNQRSYMLPNNNKYFGYFGKLSTPESKKYNNPDRYFPWASTFRGSEMLDIIL